MPDFQDMLNDPDYQSLPPERQMTMRRMFFRNVATDPDYQSLPQEKRMEIGRGILFPGAETEQAKPAREPLTIGGEAKGGLQQIKEGLKQGAGNPLSSPLPVALGAIRTVSAPITAPLVNLATKAGEKIEDVTQGTRLQKNIPGTSIAPSDVAAGLTSGAIETMGANVAGSAIGKAARTATGFIGRETGGGTQKLLDKYGQKLTDIIPGIEGEKFTPSRFFDVVVGGKGDEALQSAYKAGVNEIKQQVGQNAFIQNPEVTAIIKGSLPKSDYFKTSAIVQTLGGRQVPADLALSQSAGQPISVDNAIKAAKEIGIRAQQARRTDPILAGDLAEANSKLRKIITGELNNMSAGAGDIYKGINREFHRGTTVLEVLNDNAEKIFPPGATGATVNTAELGRANQMALAKLRAIDAEDLATAASRGAAPGGGDVSARLPFTSWAFGEGTPLHGRVGTRGLSMPIYGGPPTATGPILPYMSGGLTTERLRQLIEEARKGKAE